MVEEQVIKMRTKLEIISRTTIEAKIMVILIIPGFTDIMTEINLQVRMANLHVEDFIILMKGNIINHQLHGQHVQRNIPNV